MLYEMIVGELPYKAEDPIAIALKHRDEPVPRLPSHMQQYQATIDRLLAKRMEDRFADADSLIAALDGKIPRADLSPTTIRDKKSDKSQPPDSKRPNAKQGSSVDREAKFNPDTKQDGSRTGNSVRRSLLQSVSASPILMGVSAAGVVLAVVVGVWLAIRGPSPERPQAMAVTGADVPEVTTAMPGVTEISEPKSEFAAGATFLDCSGCPEMIAVAAGEYLQGSPDDEPGRQKNEGPRHAVTISYPLGVGKYEVTRSQFAQFVTETKRPLDGCWSYAGDWKMRKSSNWQSPGFSQSEDHPATCLSWADAKDYAEWLTRKTGKPYRLLSSSEWEYIARAGNGLARNWGSNPGTACDWANVADQSAELSYPGWTTHPCTDRFVHTAPVDTYRPNDFGIYGTLGNVFEWVEDCYHDGYDGIPADGSAVTTSGCTEHVLRGGSWFSRPEYVRSAFLNHFDKNMRSSTFGLRVARNLQPK
jgi:formylglycine-generating enzyme required for sulfatase activity